MITKRKWISIISTVGLIVMVIGTYLGAQLIQHNVNQEAQAVLTGPSLSIVPEAVIVSQVGQTRSYSVSLNTNGDTVSAATLEFSFDPAAIEILGFQVGSALPLVLKPFSFGGGLAQVSLGASYTAPLNGAGELGTLRIKHLVVKPSTITFTRNTATASFGKTSNSLVRLTGTNINIVSSNPTSSSSPIKQE